MMRASLILLLCMLFVQSLDAQNVHNQRQFDEKLAREFYYKKDYEKARDIYKNLYDNYKQVSYFTQYADCLILTGDYEAAEKAYKSFLKSNPKNWKAHVDLAYVYSQQGDNPKAVKYLNKVTYKLGRVKLPKVVHTLAYAYEFHCHIELVGNGDGDSALCRSVKLCDDDTGKVGNVTELLCL